MQYEIFGDNLPAVTIKLSQGDDHAGIRKQADSVSSPIL